MVGTLGKSLSSHIPTRALCAALEELAATYQELGARAELAELRTGLAHLLNGDRQS
ncbi:hypothetical protein Terro_2930 [Terriglobus roseus DSM 18391]|uniref:Uncharacterized protein n=1 Tax=Terriglobus roseus (strain DSM 18391 / NRRL B-41598 / KBS 63) TaxID=926566 RepID=I3ZIU7_TERRK|nr:hypothetical protein Terro_2930 [Terriglobus roseus DSM 18391]